MGLTLSLWSLDLSRTNRWTSLVVGIAEDCSLDIIVALETLLVLCDNGWEGCYHPGEAQAGHHLRDLLAPPSLSSISRIVTVLNISVTIFIIFNCIFCTSRGNGLGG